MKYFLVLLFTLLLLPNIFCQDYILEFDKYNSTYNYHWRGIEQIDENNLKNRFLEFCKAKGLLKNERSMYEANSSMGFFPNKLTLVDLNNDNKLDIIYAGNSGGEADVVKFFIQLSDGFAQVFEVYQGIVKVDWKENKINKVYTHDWGCCADYRLKNAVYEVNFNDQNIPTFHQIYQSVEISFMTKPHEYFDKPKEFIVENDKYKLRFQPVIDDTTYLNADLSNERLGNTIGFLKKGTHAKAYASKTDETGRVWWYVEIPSESSLTDNLIYTDDIDNSTSVVGWLSSRYVKEIN